MAISIFLFFEWGGYAITTKAEREGMAKTITRAPGLPANFLRVYSKVYPEALQNGMWHYVFKSSPDGDYPTRDAAVDYCIHNRNGSFLTITLMTFLLEDYATPLQCLQYNFSRCDFAYTKNLGAEAASQHYFKKPLKDITDEQVLELLVMVKNPSLYNKYGSDKRRGLFYTQLASLRQKYNSEK